MQLDKAQENHILKLVQAKPVIDFKRPFKYQKKRIDLKGRRMQTEKEIQILKENSILVEKIKQLGKGKELKKKIKQLKRKAKF